MLIYARNGITEKDGPRGHVSENSQNVSDFEALVNDSKRKTLQEKK
jgi:hypothetical protein